MKIGDFGAIAGVTAVAVAAVLGGAFHSGPRIVVGLLLAGVICLSVMLWRDRLAGEEWLALAFIGWGACSAIVAGSTPLVAREVVTSWLIAWCLWILARRATIRAAQNGADILVAAAVFLVLGIVLEVIGLGGIRVGGLLENPNVAAALVVVSLSLAFIPSFDRRAMWRVVLVVSLGAGVVLTGSRAGLLALLAVAAAALPRGKVRTAGVAFGSLCAAGVLTWRFVSQPDVLAWFRPAIWSAVLKLWASHPVFGVGPGGLVDAAGPVRLLHDDHVGQRQFLISYAESSPLAVLVQTGAVGLVLAAVAIAMWFIRSRTSGALESTPLRTGLWAIIVMAAFHDFLNVDVVIWWWALAVGLLEASTGKTPATNAAAPTQATRVLCAMVLSYVVLWGVVQPSWARWLWETGERDDGLVERALRVEPWFDHPVEWRVRTLLQKPDWNWTVAGEALARSRQAVKIHPGAARLWSEQGIVISRIVNDFGPWPDIIEEARTAFARSVELEPFQPWALLEWARFERGLGNPDRSAVLVHKALEAEPHTVRAHLFLARLELDRARLQQAGEALEGARASIKRRSTSGLNAYEKELLAAPEWQIRELEKALR